jgi:excinuclease ABC subunit A
MRAADHDTSRFVCVHGARELMTQLQGLVVTGDTVIVVEHEERVIAASDWVIEVGPGAGNEGGRVVRAGRSQVTD